MMSSLKDDYLSMLMEMTFLAWVMILPSKVI